jgi:glycosyltransferase involved in cell wall biosynthesis
MPNFPASAVVPTIDRPETLGRTLQSLVGQDWRPQEVIVVDASSDERSRDLVAALGADFAAGGCRLIWRRATARGAASQRNEGVAAASRPLIFFLDDDIIFEPHCVERLWAALQSDAELGGVNAMIINQHYQAPGRVSRLLFRAMAGRAEKSYAGRVLGPAVNLLPEDRDDLPDTVATEWLNTTCTLYRSDALPMPPFSDRFTGYSLLEDVALSLVVARRWKLANARTARIFHDSQPGSHKDDIATASRMELTNRCYVMADVLQRCGIRDYARLLLWESFQLTIAAVQTRCGSRFWQLLYGKWLGLCDILRETAVRGTRG